MFPKIGSSSQKPGHLEREPTGGTPPAASLTRKLRLSLVLRKESISMNALRAVAHVATRVHAPSLRAAPISLSLRGFSITYSGGQASEGQGGFYGSGGSRKNTAQIKHHPEAVGDLEDIRTLVAIMEHVEKLEEKLAESMASHGSSVNEESIELKVRSHWHSLWVAANCYTSSIFP